MNRQNRTRRIAIILAALLAVYTIIGFFVVPWVGKKMLLTQLNTTLGRVVTIDAVSMNPYSLTVGVTGFRVKEKTGDDFISVTSLLMNMSMASVFKLAPVISRFELESPVVSLTLKKDGTFNFSDLMPKEDTKTTDSVPESPEIFGFKLSNATIVNGRINFSDQIRKTQVIIEKLNLNLPFLSSLEKDRQTNAMAEIDSLLNQAKIQVNLESLPFMKGRDSTMGLKTDTIDLLPYLPYLPLPKNLLVTHLDAFFDLSLSYSQAASQAKPALILKGAAGFANIDIQDIDGTKILSSPRITLFIAPSNILDKKLDLSNLKIVSPKFYLSRDADANLNILKYLPVSDAPGTGAPDTPAPDTQAVDKEKSGFVFQLESGEITDASLFFTDATGRKPFETILSPVSIQIKDLTTKEGLQGEWTISVKTEADESLATKGKFATNPFGIEGSVALGKLSLPKYAPYYEDLINFDIQDGQAQVDADFSITKSKADSAIVIHNRELRLTQLKLWDRVNKEAPVIIPELTFTASVLDTGEKRLDLGQITTSQGQILLKRQADASINLVKNLASSMPAAGDKKRSKDQKPALTADLQAPIPWNISLSSLELENFFLAFSDASTKEPVSIDLSEIRIQTDDLKFSGTQKAAIDVGMKWNKSGKIQIKGDLIPSTLTAGLDLFVEKIDINSLEPYFADLDLSVTKGFLQTQGRLDLFFNNKKDKKSKPLISFKGDASVTDFVSVEKTSNTAFFNCNSFFLSGMDLSLFPIKVGIKDISITDFYSRILISEKGEINVRQVFFRKEKQETPSGSKKVLAAKEENSSPLPDITIDNVTLQGGTIQYEDHFTQPNVAADMKEIAGQIKGLSSKDTSMGELQLQGVHGKSSPLEISGRIRPLTPQRFFDLDISFKDIDLTRFSPYAAKYIGYKIEKGKLVMNLKYKIDGNKLESQNSLFLDQFTLGEKVDSKDATSLPMPLAISLLKNADNQIDLNLPVSGNLNDPKFSFANAFFGIFKNLITKVVTAPFKFLGAMFGGGEELGFVNFKFGSDLIGDPEIEKLDQLVHILAEKKELKLDIIGTYDRNRDGQALRENRYEALLKSEKLKGLTKKGSATPSIEEVTLSPEEREAAILDAYERADFAKPREERGREKEISTKEKEKLLVTHVDIKENDFKSLAMARTENVKAYILSTAKVAPARLFLHVPHSVESGPDQEGFGKVNFSIK